MQAETEMGMVPERAENELNRREFMRLALMSSALLMSSRSPLGESDADSSPVSYFGALRALPPGAVRPEGWLREYLLKQAAQLGSHLPEVSWPFTKAYWAEEQQGRTGCSNNSLKPGGHGSKKHTGSTEQLGLPSCSMTRLF